MPEPLLKGCCFDRWFEDRDNVELEKNALFKVDEYGFFIYWKSEGRVSWHIVNFYLEVFLFNFLILFGVELVYMNKIVIEYLECFYY